MDSTATAVAPYHVSDYERITYYHGISLDPPELLSPGAQHSSPGKIIVKYFLKTFTIESCYDFRD